MYMHTQASTDHLLKCLDLPDTTSKAGALACSKPTPLIGILYLVAVCVSHKSWQRTLIVIVVHESNGLDG